MKHFVFKVWSDSARQAAAEARRGGKEGTGPGDKSGEKAYKTVMNSKEVAEKGLNQQQKESLAKAVQEGQQILERGKAVAIVTGDLEGVAVFRAESDQGDYQKGHYYATGIENAPSSDLGTSTPNLGSVLFQHGSTFSMDDKWDGKTRVFSDLKENNNHGFERDEDAMAAMKG